MAVCLIFKWLSVFAASSEVFAEVLCSGDMSLCLAELEEVPLSSLWPRNSTLRALASLLTAEEPQVNKAAADYLSSGASNRHFRNRVSGAEQKRMPAPFPIVSTEAAFECRRVSSAGGGVLHPGAVRGRRSEPEGGLLGSRLSAGEDWLTSAGAFTLT